MRKEIVFVLGAVSLACLGFPAAAVPFNNAPIAVNDTASMGGCQIEYFDVLANDSDPDNDTLTIISVEQPLSGSSSIEGSEIQFISEDQGVYEIAYTISDGHGGTALASLTVTVGRRGC